MSSAERTVDLLDYFFFSRKYCFRFISSREVNVKLLVAFCSPAFELKCKANTFLLSYCTNIFEYLKSVLLNSRLDVDLN